MEAKIMADVKTTLKSVPTYVKQNAKPMGIGAAAGALVTLGISAVVKAAGKKAASKKN